MSKRIATWLILVVAMGLGCLSCQKGLEDYTFTYSMESPGNYKIQVYFDDEGHYKVERFNYFMDNMANRQAPKILEGELTDEELARVTEVLTEADLFAMEDSYGFEEVADSKNLGDVLTQIYMKSGSQEKYISIRNMLSETFPMGYIELVNFINQFCVDHPVE